VSAEDIQHVLDSIDGALEDWSSADGARWSTEEPASPGGWLGGPDVSPTPPDAEYAQGGYVRELAERSRGLFQTLPTQWPGGRAIDVTSPSPELMRWIRERYGEGRRHREEELPGLLARRCATCRGRGIMLRALPHRVDYSSFLDPGEPASEAVMTEEVPCASCAGTGVTGRMRPTMDDLVRLVHRPWVARVAVGHAVWDWLRHQAVAHDPAPWREPWRAPPSHFYGVPVELNGALPEWAMLIERRGGSVLLVEIEGT